MTVPGFGNGELVVGKEALTLSGKGAHPAPLGEFKFVSILGRAGCKLDPGLKAPGFKSSTQ